MRTNAYCPKWQSFALALQPEPSYKIVVYIGSFYVDTTHCKVEIQIARFSSADVQRAVFDIVVK